MKKLVTSLGVASAMAILSGCNSGITYGTGEVHEVQTLKGLSNALNIKAPEGAKIDYAARPDLVLPANKDVLPAPSDRVDTDDANWPVSPEQRIATLRGQAPEPDRDGNLPVEYLTDTNKLGIRKTKSSKNDRSRIPENRNGVADHADIVRADARKGNVSDEVNRRRDELSFAKGANRKYLTEPPTLYRTPSAEAEAGDLGISEEELKAQQKLKREVTRAVPKQANQL